MTFLHILSAAIVKMALMQRKFARQAAIGLMAAAIIALQFAPLAQAAIYYWDNDGTTAGFGTAAGTWAVPTTGSTTQGWSPDATGATLPVNVTTQTTDTVNFGNTATGLAAGTITVTGTVSNGGMTFASGSGAIVLSGGTITNVAAETITVNNASDTISSILAGAASSLTVGGSGTLALTGLNTYVGKTIIGNNTAGTLRVQVNTLGNLSAPSSLGAPTTAANGVIQIGATSLGSTLEFTGASAAASTNRQIQIGVSNTGSGGATIVNNNATSTTTLTFSNAAFNVAATGVSTFNRTLTLGGLNTGSNTVTGIIVNNTGTSGGIVSLSKTGAGTWILNGANSYTGGTTITGGALTIGNATGLGSVTGGGVSVTSGAVLQLNGITVGAKNLTINGAGLTTLAQGALNNISATAATYGGAVTLGSSSTIGVKGTGQLTLSGTIGIGAFTLTTLNASAARLQLNGVISGAGSVVAKERPKNNFL